MEPSSDSFHLSCSDGINLDNFGLTFEIEIAPINDESPKIYVNDFVVEEGRLLQIDLPILNAYDKDLPPNLIMFKVSIFLRSCITESFRSQMVNQINLHK